MGMFVSNAAGARENEMVLKKAALLANCSAFTYLVGFIFPTKLELAGTTIGDLDVTREVIQLVTREVCALMISGFGDISTEELVAK